MSSSVSAVANSLEQLIEEFAVRIEVQRLRSAQKDAGSRAGAFDDFLLEYDLLLYAQGMARINYDATTADATKLAQEHILAVWCRANDAALTTLRLQNVYGPGQSLTNSYTGIVTLFSQMARAGRAIPLYEDGQVTRDFVYISDVAAAFERSRTYHLIARCIVDPHIRIILVHGVVRLFALNSRREW